MGRYYLHDLETDKLEIHTAGKADWLSLSEQDRSEVKRNCLWSNRRGCWVSRALAGRARIYLGDTLARLGFEDRGTTGEKLTFAEKVEAKQDRAGERSERMEDRAEKAEACAVAHSKAGNAISDMIPMGQPILVGHHSEGRHRRDLAKIDGHMRQTCEAIDRKEHYERRAAAARETAEGAQYSDPGFLGRRIKEGEAEERLLCRRLEGIQAGIPGSFDYDQRLRQALAECRDKLGHYRHCLETCGRKVWGKASLAGKTAVFLRGQWQAIVKLNKTTVAVPNICFPTEESQRKYALKYIYAEVRDAR